MTKHCKCCNETKPITAFYKKTEERLFGKCIDCTKTVSKAYRQRTKNKLNAQNKAYREQNRESVAEYAKQYREKNLEHVKERSRSYYQDNFEKNREMCLKRNYGITGADYDRMFSEQQGRCKICGSTESKSKSSKHLAVDHCHTTGKVRGLLCHPCNHGLGRFQDNTELLEQAIKYLEQAK